MNANRSETAAKNVGSRSRPPLPRTSALVIGAALLGLVAASARGQIILSSSLGYGAAAGFAGLELGSKTLSASETAGTKLDIEGNLGVASYGDLSFAGSADTGSLYTGYYSTVSLTDGSTVSGSLYEPPSPNHDTVTISGGSSVAGGTKTTTATYLSSAVAAADNAASYYGGLAANHTTISAITTSLSLGSTGIGGTQVYKVAGNISLDGGQSLTLSGNVNTLIVLNVSGSLSLTNGAYIALNGISSDQVLFNFVGGSSTSVSINDSSTQGIFLATNGQAITVNGGVQASSFITNGDLTLDTSCGDSLFVDVPPIPEPSTYAMWGAVACFSAALWRRRREAFQIEA